VRIEPDAAFQGLFVRKGKLTLWVSEDERRILTRVVAVIPVANVRIHLDRVLGPGNDRWVKNKGGT
jgi:biotin synthase-related radical SAM superfamily protein